MATCRDLDKCCGTGGALPPGGTTGQSLVKNSDLSFDAVWVDNALDVNIKPAGENVPADRVVVLIGGSVFLFDPSDNSHYGKVLGLSLNAGTTGEDIRISKTDKVSVGVTLTQGAVYYAGASGVLQTAVVSSGIVQRVGIACSTSELILQLYIPIITIT